MWSDKSKKCDEHLDIEYLNTLRNIKPYITCIMNNHYIELVRVWLEKLSDIKVENKALRNEYLVELGKQIVSGVFVEPFVDPPFPGHLPQFKQSWKNKSLQVTRTNKNPWVQSINKNECSSSEEQSAYKLETGNQQQINQTVLASTTPSPNINPNNKRKTAQERLNEVRENIHKMQQYTRTLSNNSANKNLRKKKSRAKRQHNIHTANQAQPQNGLVQLAPNYENFYGTARNELYIPLVQNEKMLKMPPVGEDSSWMDLTDISTNATVYGSGDATPRMCDLREAEQMQEVYERKIAHLMDVIGELREENIILSQHVDKYQKDLRLSNNKAETSLHNLATEVECLKGRLQELVDIKLSLQNNRFTIVSEWQNTVATLQKKLSVLQKRYNELKLENNDLIKKHEELDAEKKKELSGLKQKLTEFHSRETDMLKEVHARDITELESKFNQNMVDLELDYQKKVNELKENYENRFTNWKEDLESKSNFTKDEFELKLSNIRLEYEEIISQKDVEIEKLEQLLQEQCIRMQEEVQVIRSQIESNISNSSDSYVEKIAFLQKCIIKMEKLYQRAEKENARQLMRLKKELDYKTKKNQLALTTQKAELLANCLDGKQNEVEQIFAELEEHYKNIITEQQKRALEEKRQDVKLIEDLKAELAKYRSEY